jgi:peptide/nickel transport system permease protein
MDFATTFLIFDEFGRNIYLTVTAAIVISVLKAFTTALIVLGITYSIVAVTEFKGKGYLRLFSDVGIASIESVPAFIWVLAGISAFPSGGATVVVGIFALVSLPLAFNTVGFAVRNTMAQTYYRAAIALGGSEWHLLKVHILPNSFPYCVPLFIYLLGSAIAIYGAIGIFGFVNRQELDLGVFLLRAKEQAPLEAWLLVITLLSYLGIYVMLRWALVRYTDRLINDPRGGPRVRNGWPVAGE